MYPITSRFRTALREGHKVATAVEVWDTGVPYSIQGTISGGVNVDEADAIRRRCHITVADATYANVPTSLEDLLAPNGNELRLYRGIDFQDGTIEYIPLGVFGIADVEIDDAGQSMNIRINGFDRARKVQRARWTEPYVIPAGTNYGTAIRDGIASRFPGLLYNFMLTTKTTPLIVLGEETENDPWADFRKMADSLGADLFFDAQGVCTMLPVNDPNVAAVVETYEEGEGGNTMFFRKKLTDERTYNGVIVRGEPADAAPVRAEAWDTNVESPTYRYGDFGQVPYFITSTFITTQQQAQDAADAQLIKVLGATEDIQFISLVNPAHEAGDVVNVIRSASKINGRYALKTFNVPLEAQQPMNATVRSERIV